MPRRDDLHKILLIGSGPIVIGQACEFDYSGTQACRALRGAGYEVVLVNSNPATIMTDPDVADRTYVEPLTLEVLERVIERERPDALLPTLGGQTALNLAVDLANRGVLEKYGVELIGASLWAIETAEDRDRFKQTVLKAGCEVPRSGYAHSMEEAKRLGEEIGFPLVVRASFTLGGLGSATVWAESELEHAVARGLSASPVGRILLEEYLAGWQEFELEVMRDRRDNVVIVCSIENFDPMGIHTGDSITVAPAQTLSDRDYQRMRDAAQRIMRAIQVDAGGSNIQFAVNPRDGRMLVIEMNPRVSRSSALASKATGFPIAKISALLAVGYTLDEIPNDITKKTPACFEPALDYCVVKIPRWAFEKFPAADPVLGTRMKSVGEIMAIGRTFPEALLKGLRSLELDGSAKGLGQAAGEEDLPALREQLRLPTWQRIRQLWAALAVGEPPMEVSRYTAIDPWFLHQIQRVTDLENEIREQGTIEALDPDTLRRAKRLGLGDAHLAHLTGAREAEVRARRLALGIRPVYKAVDTCAAEFDAETPYFYSTYEEENEARPGGGQKVMILGSGPNRIGQGIEFDYCCVQAAFALRDAGFEVVLVNSNPETVSTDYDVSTRLYFEPLTLEDVLHIVDTEKPEGVIVQLGGQTPLKLARGLDEAGVPLWGTSFDDIDRAENRARFADVVRELGLRQPANATASTREQALTEAQRLGYPVLARPSYVLGGRGMRVVYDRGQLASLLEEMPPSAEEPVLLDEFLEGAIEVDVDALSDGTETLVAAVLEHIEEAGIHSGDSSCVIPPYSLGEEMVERIHEATKALAAKLRVRGLLNVQFAVRGQALYVLEANPRASRTVPFVSKAVGIPLAQWAALVLSGKTLRELNAIDIPEPKLVSVKKPVLPFNRFPGEDSLLGPEMKSTGEVMGRDVDFGYAFAKAHAGAGESLPTGGTVFLSLRDEDKRPALFLARKLADFGFHLLATRGTWRFLTMNGIECERVFKVNEGSPNVVERIAAGSVHLVINTPLGRESLFDEKAIRAAAVAHGVPCVTTIQGATAAVAAIESQIRRALDVRHLQEEDNAVAAEARTS
ncbi:MAG TPA: carbamoyl-phosphate synthase large subunit [Candidatus Eisenbacteria bacterium]|nr:carbamoyl-phosphate synthase large subunit [Candidatus Eisenbacteria bacterium]